MVRKKLHVLKGSYKEMYCCYKVDVNCQNDGRSSCDCLIFLQSLIFLLFEVKQFFRERFRTLHYMYG